MRTGKTMFRAFLARLASGGFGAGLRALLFLFFFDITPLLQRQIERFPPGEESSANPTIGRLIGRIAVSQAGVKQDFPRIFWMPWRGFALAAG